MPRNKAVAVTDGPPANTSDTSVERLFFENGASWYWVLTGPVAAAIMLGIEINSGLGPRLVVPGFFLVMVSGFIALQVKAARIHTSVELTPDTLRQGTEELRIDEIVRVIQEPAQPMKSATARPLMTLLYPRAHKEDDGTAPKWQYSRALGELTGVPRGRVGIGLKLTQDRTVQAWARRHGTLRVALNDLVEQRQRRDNPPTGP
jgi:hypothetical protein